MCQAPIGYKYVLVPLYDPQVARDEAIRKQVAEDCARIVETRLFGDAQHKIREKYGLPSTKIR